MPGPIDLLEQDAITLILGYLQWKDILKARVSTKWKDAARLTKVPQSQIEVYPGWKTDELYVQNRNIGNALSWISVALPLFPSLQFDFGLSKTKKFEIVNVLVVHPSEVMRLDVGEKYFFLHVR